MSRSPDYDRRRSRSPPARSSTNPTLSGTYNTSSGHIDPVEMNLPIATGKIFIGGLSFNATEQTLRDFFNKYGSIASVEIVTDKFTQRSRGFGFLEFADDTVIDTLLDDYKRDPSSFVLDNRQMYPRRAVTKEAMKDVTSDRQRTTKVFVGGIENSTEQQIRDLFTPYGTVELIEMITDKVTGNSRGFCFVSFASEAVVDDIIQKQKQQRIELNGKTLEVKKAVPKEQQQPRSTDRGRGGYGGDSRGYNDRYGGSSRGYEDQRGGYDSGYGGRSGGYDRYDDRRGGYDAPHNSSRYDDRRYDERDDRYRSNPPYASREYDRGYSSRGYDRPSDRPDTRSRDYDRSPEPAYNRAPRY